MKLCSNKCGPLYFHTSLFGLCLLLFQGFLEHQLAQEDPGKKKLIMIKNPFFTITTDINRKKKNLQLCRPLQDRPKTRSTVNIWSKERKFWTHLKMSTHRFSVSSWRSCRTVRSWWSRWSDWSWYLLHNRAVPKADHLSCRARRTFRPRRPLSPSFPFVARVTKPRTALERKEKNKSKMYFSGSNLFL